MTHSFTKEYNDGYVTYTTLHYYGYQLKIVSLTSIEEIDNMPDFHEGFISWLLRKNSIKEKEHLAYQAFNNAQAFVNFMEKYSETSYVNISIIDQEQYDNYEGIQSAIDKIFISKNLEVIVDCANLYIEKETIKNFNEKLNEIYESDKYTSYAHEKAEKIIDHALLLKNIIEANKQYMNSSDKEVSEKAKKITTITEKKMNELDQQFQSIVNFKDEEFIDQNNENILSDFKKVKEIESALAGSF